MKNDNNLPKQVALSYLNSDTIYGTAKKFGISRNKASKLIHRAIVFGMVSDEVASNIANKVTNYTNSKLCYPYCQKSMNTYYANLLKSRKKYKELETQLSENIGTLTTILNDELEYAKFTLETSNDNIFSEDEAYFYKKIASLRSLEEINSELSRLKKQNYSNISSPIAENIIYLEEQISYLSKQY